MMRILKAAKLIITEILMRLLMASVRQKILQMTVVHRDLLTTASGLFLCISRIKKTLNLNLNY